MVLKIAAPETGGRILLVDRLPAGLEIENPRLVDSGDIKSLDWLKTTVQPEHTEFRDDRFVAAFDFFGSATRAAARRWRRREREPASSATVAYMVRAVTPGSFVHPAATVEDMYRPDRFARTASGRLEVDRPRSDGDAPPIATGTVKRSGSAARDCASAGARDTWSRGRAVGAATRLPCHGGM